MNDDELQALLRGADPATSLPPADRAWVTDHLEDAVITTRPTPTADDAAGHARAARRRRPWLVGIAVAVGVAAAAVVATPVVLSLAPEPAATQLSVGSFDLLTTSCAVVEQILPDADTAFAGRVTGVDGTRVSLDVEHVYRGEPGERVVVVDAQAQDDAAVALVGGAAFEVGGEYLVSATGGVVAPCGASGPTTPELQAEYERAFGG